MQEMGPNLWSRRLFIVYLIMFVIIIVNHLLISLVFASCETCTQENPILYYNRLGGEVYFQEIASILSITAVIFIILTTFAIVFYFLGRWKHNHQGYFGISTIILTIAVPSQILPAVYMGTLAVQKIQFMFAFILSLCFFILSLALFASHLWIQKHRDPFS